MKYETDLEVESQPPTRHHFKYEASYDVGSYPALCALTGIFFGGACWFYTVMPTTGQREQVKRDAEEKLEELLGQKDYSLRKTRIKQAGWGSGEERATLTP